MAENNKDINISILKDKLACWPTKMYYFLSNPKFNIKLMWELEGLAEIEPNKEV